MTIAEVLQLVDRLVEKQTGKHLNDLEKTVVKGLWEGKTYSEIADEHGYDTNYIGDISRLLLKHLSEQLNEKVNKANFCWTIERAKNSQFFGFVNGNVTWCHPETQPISNPSIAATEITNKKTGYRDLAIAPIINHFCDRRTELQTLSHWVLEPNTRLISVLGLPGIGKTTLVKKFVDLNLSAFDVIVWKSLKFSHSLDSIITDICFQANLDKSIIADNAISQLFNILSHQRCLLILDDVQELFTPGELAGKYKNEYEDYQVLFNRFREIAHQSCVILLSQEQSQEMFCYNDDSPVKYLELKGLTDSDYFKPLGLSDEKSWSNLMTAYEGHPAYLKDVASLITHVFRGKVANFLAEDGLVLPADTQLQLKVVFQRLSPIEKQIILKLSQFDQPITKAELKQGLDLSSMALINGLQSLTRRYLIKIIAADTILVDLSGVFREYLRIPDKNDQTT